MNPASPPGQPARPWLWLIAGVVLGLVAGWFLPYPRPFAEQTTVTSLSPDDSARVSLVEVPAGIDRQFHVRVEQPTGSDPVTVFRSPDEGRPGSERFIWSADGSRFVLLGRHFSVHDGATLPTREQLYLMMDLPTGQIWCNAKQQSAHPRFTLADVPWLKP